MAGPSPKRPAMTAMRGKIGAVIGRLEDNAMVDVERRLAVFLGDREMSCLWRNARFMDYGG